MIHARLDEGRAPAPRLGTMTHTALTRFDLSAVFRRTLQVIQDIFTGKASLTFVVALVLYGLSLLWMYWTSYWDRSAQSQVFATSAEVLSTLLVNLARALLWVLLSASALRSLRRRDSSIQPHVSTSSQTVKVVVVAWIIFVAEDWLHLSVTVTPSNANVSSVLPALYWASLIVIWGGWGILVPFLVDYPSSTRHAVSTSFRFMGGHRLVYCALFGTLNLLAASIFAWTTIFPVVGTRSLLPNHVAWLENDSIAILMSMPILVAQVVFSASFYYGLIVSKAPQLRRGIESEFD